MISKNIKETSRVAKIFLGKILRKKNAKALVVSLSGNLGAGKTAFVQTLAKHLGIKAKVSSPTFVIAKKYKIKTKGHKFLFHLDAYRLKNKKELLNLGWADIIGDREHIVFIEWPEQVKGALPKHAHKVKISANKAGHRKFSFN